MRYWIIFLLGMELACCGCVGGRRFGFPHPEPVPRPVTERRAERFDPYPDPNIGPAIPGSRPRCFETPATEKYSTPKFQRL